MSNSTRLDIACLGSRLSKYARIPNSTHWFAVVKLFKYLKGTIDYNLYYSGTLPILKGYYDANGISDIMDTKSTSGNVFILGGEAIS